jgi:hypothetical protein
MTPSQDLHVRPGRSRRPAVPQAKSVAGFQPVRPSVQKRTQFAVPTTDQR